ncbi:MULTISPECIES: OmpW family outer membrane protein [unclassified Luteimonas]|uniref:OmpW/AlkL family protein n=1 Tax=unclassified Luteimonas TaxID=2629088 RepID=UPI0015FEBB83|nr:MULTISPECIES: OmpW family outer membrane protein [unclassified Luteimonas]MBB1473716.1 OmpW family protein [Luteimonas sp. MC1782]MBB6600069.1 OmpW family protein [Luteimonas sp. MC1825]QOC87771.1 OmpW family protein [Luteimonas sp. MC1825]
MRFKTIPLVALALCGAIAAPAALAQSTGDWTVALGAHQVNPDSDNGKLAAGTLPLDIGSSTRPTIAVEYFVRDNLGLEVLAALPFQHDIAISGLGRVGSTKHLPPTVSLQYHFNGQGKVSPLLGVGVNYTTFFSEDARGALAGSKLELDDSWGLALHAGLDFKVGEKGSIRVDVRWMDIDSDVTLDGAKLGTANIDPLVYGAAYVMRF